MKADEVCVHVRLSGGLGNQLFQLSAALYAVRLRPAAEILLDIRFLGSYESARSFEIAFLVKYLQRIHVVDSNLGFIGLASRFRLGRIIDRSLAGYAFVGTAETLTKVQGDYYPRYLLDGYFQHPDFALPSDVRRRVFTALTSEFSYLTQRVRPTNASSLVGIHVRRGDFVSSISASSVFLTVGLEYYRAAVRRFPQDTTFVVFSDDGDITALLAKDVGGIDVTLMGLSLVEEFVLLSLCDHHIIANSTFSWWAAYLGHSSERRVVSPRVWYVDSHRSATNPLLMPHFELV
jgi:hypothetical protein